MNRKTEKREGLAGRAAVLSALVGVVCLLTGCGVQDAAYVISLDHTMQASETGDAAPEESAEGDLVIDTRSEAALIYVYVCGAVADPKVVELPEGSRAEDALFAAGGFAEDAQTDYVNLAAKVSDGEKLYFPTVWEAEQLETESKEAESGLVNINTADLTGLCTLPGIGASRAQDIIDYREANGAFQSVEDIMNVTGIKTGVYEKLCEKITVK